MISSMKTGIKGEILTEKMKRSPDERHIKKHMENCEMFQHSQRSSSIRNGWMYINTL